MYHTIVSHRKASILIITLWSLCILSVFAVYLGYSSRQKLIFIKRLDEISRLRYIAEAGIKKATSLLDFDSEMSYFALNGELSSNPVLFQDIELDGGVFNVCYSYLDSQSGLNKLQYGLVDEARKININKADLTLLTRFFVVALNLGETEAQGLAGSIIDWRDKDSALSIPLGSAEDSYYRNQEFPYEAKDSDFQLIEELLLVRGFDQNIFEKVKNYLTVHGDGLININTATRPVLLALGLSERLVDSIIIFRQGEDEAIGTEDDNIFQSGVDIVPKLSQTFELSSSEVALLSNIASQSLTTNSEKFTIRSIANLKNKNNKLTSTCVVDREGKILYWQES